MTSQEIRQSFLDFFQEKKHTIVPSASLMPSAPNLLFTNAGMNQFVPYFLGTETAPYDPPRAADTQKCIRAGGKHNDLDDVGLDTYHHTFFEMLGNWSFGDYFKKEAIDWAWELLTERWKFPAKRLYATVYRPGLNDPGEYDEESHDFWEKKFTDAGLDPKIHIVDGGPKDNFWAMGDTGPCGPCSELHIDLTRDGGSAGRLVNKDDPRCIEIWNLVFIQYNREQDGSFKPLPARHVDTGMGFERVCSVMQGTEGFKDFEKLPSNYDTDVFAPLFEKIAAVTGKRYGGTIPKPGVKNLKDKEKVDMAFRVLADHARTLSFAIADGILPGNKDRNYVLRRIIRRAMRYALNLDLEFPMPGGQALMPQLAEVVISQNGEVFPELKKKRELILETLAAEEESFARTLAKGIDLFQAQLEKLKKRKSKDLPAEVAFELYDTHGFPIDLTQIMVGENGLSLDTSAVETLMEEQRKRSQDARQTEVVLAEDQLRVGATAFEGFTEDSLTTELLELVERGDDTFAVTAETPFYAQMGGQVGDSGFLTLDGYEVAITDTQKVGDVFLHKLAEPLPTGYEPPLEVELSLDVPRRRNIEAHHTATHLLHWAIHEHIGEEATQKGSLVAPDRLRFDFNSRPLTPEQLEAIEESVNVAILANEEVSWTEQPFDEVTRRADIKQLFGEKYGDMVRVVQIGGAPGELDGYSMELCGGTHVRRTGELGIFKLVSEGAVAAGIRRIEAVTGRPGIEHVLQALKDERARTAELEGQVVEAKKALDKERSAQAQREAARVIRDLIATLDTGAELPQIQHDFGETGDPGLLQAAVNACKAEKLRGSAVFYLQASGKTHYAVYVSPEFQKSHPANELLRGIAERLGGKGGGNKETARGAA